MAENFKQNETDETANEPEILTNNYGTTRDSTVVVEEETRTVLLTDNETIVIEKQPIIDVVPKNRARRIYSGMWGNAEIATVGLGMLAVLSVIILFVLVVLPAQKELEKNRAERDRLETELATVKGKYGNITSTEARVAEIVNSANDFESRFLPIATNGRAGLYQNINGLISAYGLINTSGPEYAPLEISNDNRGQQQSENEQGRAKYQSIFPGVYVTMTVEGSYQNLRRFIREIETSNQFVVISAVELAPSENRDANDQTQQATVNSATITPQQQPNQPQNFGAAPGIPYQNGQMSPMMTQPQTQTSTTTVKKPRGVTHGETVSLHLEMAAYFRRANVAPTTGNVEY